MAKAKQRRLVAWSKDDVKNLRAFAISRLSGIQAAKQLWRSPGAVDNAYLVHHLVEETSAKALASKFRGC
jgi:hypothetical protein